MEHNSQEPMSIKEAFQGLIPDSMAVQQATVISESPLKIKMVNDEKLMPGENLLIVPRHLSKYKTKVDLNIGDEGNITGTATGSEGTSTIRMLQLSKYEMTVHNDLKLGDVVYVLSFNNGKKYYILDKERE